MKTIAKRMDHLTTHFFAAFGARIAAMRASGIDIVRMDEGSPDMPPAVHIIEALSQSASRPDSHGYQSHRGPAALRPAWAEMYQREYGVNLNPETEIVPLIGSKEGIFHLSQAYIESGDIALVPDPGYVTYARGALFSGGEVYQMTLRRENDFLPDLDEIPDSVLQRTKLMWLNYPNNPTAVVASLEFFSQIVALARHHGFWVCHDAAYTLVTYGNTRVPSILQAPGAKEVAVEFNTLSKSHNMAGWRTGVLVGNPEVVQTFFRLKTNTDSSHFMPIFAASIAALTGDQTWIKVRNQIYEQRRDLVVKTLREMGLDVRIPTAGMYVWAPTPPGWDCEEFVDGALEHAHVSLTPGSVFGKAGSGYVRFALTASLEHTEAAMQRLKEWIG